MSAYPKFRDLHLYAGLLLGLPLVVIALTGVMLNHSGRLGLKPEARAKAPPSPRPGQEAAGPQGASSFAASPRSAEPGSSPHTADPDRSSAAKDDGPHALVTRPGQWRDFGPALDAALAAAAQSWGEVPLERIELKQEAQHGMVVKIKAARDAHATDREIVWSVAQGTILWRKGPPHSGDAPIDWQRLVHDLHTGKFFSHTYGYWWSDAAGVALVLLGLTGGVLYAIPWLKKRQKRRPAPAPSLAAAPPGTSAAPPPRASAGMPLVAVARANRHDPRPS
jgi:hypothetical protein